MLVGKDDVAQKFEDIQRIYHQFGTTVIIICSIDFDSVCCYKILTTLLQTEHISYAVFPVYSYENIIYYNETVIQPKLAANELHSIVLINCGALIDLDQLFFHRRVIDDYNLLVQNALKVKREELQEQRNRRRRLRNNNDDGYDSDSDSDDIIDDEDIILDNIPLYEDYIEANVVYPDSPFSIYVIDSHRPFNLANIYDNDRIYLLQGDDEEDVSKIPAPNIPEHLPEYEDDRNQNKSNRESTASLDTDLFNNNPSHNETDFEEDDDDDDDVDDDKELDDDFLLQSSKKRRLNNGGSQISSNASVLESNSNSKSSFASADSNSNKNTNTNNSGDHNSRELARMKLKRMHDNYYKYQYSCLNSSGIMYNMATALFKDDNQTLWYSILGLTEYFIFEKISRDQYNLAVSKYQDEVRRRNSMTNITNVVNHNHNNHRNDNDSEMDSNSLFAGLDAMSTSNPSLKNFITNNSDHIRNNYSEENVENSSIVTHRHSNHIEFSQEFRFILMRFWTLYDSMYYSRYIGTRLAVWKNTGKNSLKYMFAKMALPLTETQQPFANMKREYKQQLRSLFEEYMHENHNFTNSAADSLMVSVNGLLDADIMYGSFTKQHGIHHSISASDMVYAITAVIESDFLVTVNQHQQLQQAIQISSNSNHKSDGSAAQIQPEVESGGGGGGGGGGGQDSGGEASDAPADAHGSKHYEICKKNFFLACDALELANQSILDFSINLAKKRQQEIIDMGIKLIERKAIQTLNVMRYCQINDTQNKFCKSPMLLCKLGLFLMDALNAIHQNRIRRQNMMNNQRGNRSSNSNDIRRSLINNKHFVLACLNSDTNMFMVIGIPAKKYFGDVNKSPFYRAFEDAKNRVNATANVVFFEGHVIEIAKDHFKDWMENLHERLLPYAV